MDSISTLFHFDTFTLILFLCGLILLVIIILNYSKKDGRKHVIPGLRARDKATGNLVDIKEFGSFHEFLVHLHKRFGPIASFWYGNQQVVSTASPVLWKDIQGLFDRPEILFQLFEPFLTKYSIEYANGSEGRARHKLISSSFGHEAMSKHYNHFISITEKLVEELNSTAKEEHICLQEKFMSVAVDTVMLSVLGSYFYDENKVNDYRISFYSCWTELERRLDCGIPEKGSERDIQFKTHLANMNKITTEAVERRKKMQVSDDEKILIDNLLESGYNEEMIYGDILATLVGGIHTSGLLLTWSLYFMTKYPEIQENVYQEMRDVLGEQTVTPGALNHLRYTRQVLDETLRCSVIAPYNARVSNVDLKVGEFVVPKQTPIITALGVVHQDPSIWDNPSLFNPDRFDPKEMKKKHPLTFHPFGLGKRRCPGYRFTYTEVIVVLSILLRKFKFHLVDGQEIKNVYGLISHPDKDIYVTVSKR